MRATDDQVAEYMNKINMFKRTIRHTCPDERFIKDIIDPWFNVIAPARAMQYGVQGMYRFGPKGVFAQIINCYYRWQRFQDLDFQIDWTDTMRDIFGFGVIMNIVVGYAPGRVQWPRVWKPQHTADDMFETMVNRLWERDVLIGIDVLSLGLPFAMWQEFWKEWNSKT